MFSKEHASRAVKFIESLKHTKGEWRGVNFELLPWQKEIIEDVFGTLKKNGYRQYNTAYIEVPKKNGKSELAAAVALKLLCADDEWGAEVYGCAADKEQASIVFDVAKEMVEQNKVLKNKIKIVESKKRLIYKPTRSFYQVLSSESFTKHGLNVHGVIFDELHAQPNRALYDVMTDGSGDARRQPLFFVITTAGDDPDRTSIGWEVHEYAERVINKVTKDPTFYAKIYGINESDDPWNEKNWYKSNPSLGHTIEIDKVRAAVIKAKESSAKERTFRQLRLNQWVNYKSTDWIPLDIWDNTAGIVDELKLKGQSCYAGLDLSSKTDISSFVLVFPPTEERSKWKILPYFWIPEASLKERIMRDKIDYSQWIREGLINVTPGNVIDYDFIQNYIGKLASQYHIKETAFDPWAAHQLAGKLADEGMIMVETRQGFKTLSPPTKELEKLVRGCELEHGGNKVLRWMIGNVQVKQDENENIRPIKIKGTKRIDGVVALIMALSRAIVYESNKPSVYEERGILKI